MRIFSYLSTLIGFLSFYRLVFQDPFKDLIANGKILVKLLEPQLKPKYIENVHRMRDIIFLSNIWTYPTAVLFFVLCGIYLILQMQGTIF